MSSRCFPACLALAARSPSPAQAPRLTPRALLFVSHGVRTEAGLETSSAAMERCRPGHRPLLQGRFWWSLVERAISWRLITPRPFRCCRATRFGISPQSSGPACSSWRTTFRSRRRTDSAFSGCRSASLGTDWRSMRSVMGGSVDMEWTQLQVKPAPSRSTPELAGLSEGRPYHGLGEAGQKGYPVKIDDASGTIEASRSRRTALMTRCPTQCLDLQKTLPNASSISAPALPVPPIFPRPGGLPIPVP